MNRAAPQAEFELRIGELVIDGFSPAEARAIAESLELELGRLLTQSPAPFRDGHAAPRQPIDIDRADAGTIPQAPGGSQRALGRSAARAVARQLRRLSSGEATPGRGRQP